MTLRPESARLALIPPGAGTLQRTPPVRVLSFITRRESVPM